MNVTLVELIGYIASATILVSFLMKNVKTLRIVNTFGCATFVIYGILLGWNIPMIATNVGIMAINLWYLRKN